jgi:integrase
MPSLQARHSDNCALARPWTPFAEPIDGCTCSDGPLYYVVVREGDQSHKEPVGRDRHQAEVALHQLAVDIENGDYRPRLHIGFDDWADRWLASLERKPSTVGSYRSTRCTRQECVRITPAQRPRPERKEAAYFENDELSRLFHDLCDEPYRTFSLVALKTGMRQGELLALRWCDVDLKDAVIRVRRSYRFGGVSTPKNRERRDVDLISDVVDLLTQWRARSASGRDGESLVFKADVGNRFLSPTVLLRRQLYPAMARAGIPRTGPTHEVRTFHSFRHTFAKRALENGAQITWLSRHLRHSTLKVTTDIYGHWERAERKLQAAKMEGAFPV